MGARIAFAAAAVLFAGAARAQEASYGPTSLEKASGLVLSLRAIAGGTSVASGPAIYDQGGLLFGAEGDLLVRRPSFEAGVGAGLAGLNSSSVVGRSQVLYGSVAKLGAAAKGTYYLRLEGGAHHLIDLAWKPGLVDSINGRQRHDVGSAWLPFAGLHAGLLFANPDSIDFGLGVFARFDLSRGDRNGTDQIGGYMVGFELRIDGMPIHF